MRVSEQPTNLNSLDDYREGSRFDDDIQLDLHKYKAVPKYDARAIAEVHELEAARQARKAALENERNAQKSGPENAQELLTNLAAVRAAALQGQIEVAA